MTSNGYITISMTRLYIDGMQCISNHFHFVQVSHQMINFIEDILQLNTKLCQGVVGV